MLSSTLLSVVLSAAMAAAQTAKVITDNPPKAQYVSQFQNAGSGNITGWVLAWTDPSGKGVDFQMWIEGLNATKGPYQYHVHEHPVPADGNCTATGAHLDPYMRGTATACNATAPASCQVGDLSGKYGTIAGPATATSFVDHYVSLNPADNSFIGNRSIVFHDASGARIACENLTLVEPVMAGKQPS